MNRRPLFSARRAMALALLYALPATALAKDVAIAPFIPVGGVDPKVATNVTSVIASEIEFMSEYDSAEQLSTMPAALNAACLAKTSCLKTVGTSTGKEQLIVGSVAPAGGDSYDIFMMLFDVPSGSVVNKKTITLAKSDFADKMGKQVRGLITGEGAQEAAQKAPVAANTFTDSEDEFEFAAPASNNKNLPTVNTPGNSKNSLDDYEAESAQEAAARKKAEDAARKKAADDAARKAAEDAARKKAAEEEARRVAEADARRKAEEEARRRAEEEARRVAEAEARRRAEQEASARAAQANVALDDITFGAVDPAEVEVDISDIEFGRAEVEVDEYPARSSSSSSSSSSRPSSSSSSSSSSRPAPSSSSSRSSTSTSSRPSSSSSRAIDDEIAALDGEDDEDERFVDLDELDEAPRSSSSKPSSSSSKSSSSSSKSSSSSSKNVEIKGTVDKKDQPRFGLTLRAGGSKFQELNFVTYGGELSVPVAPRGYINIGLEGWTTRRDVPERLQEIYGSSVYNTIPPLTFGASFQGNSHNARPFIGGDLTLAPYTSSFKTAVGARVRFGSDFMVSDSFGFNLSANAGALYGAELDQVQAGMKPLAPVIQASAGTIIRF